MNAVDHNNVVIFDDRGIPSIMCRFVRPKDTEEVPAVFKIGDKVADAIYISKYPNIVIDGRAYSMPMADPTVNITFDGAVQACRCKGLGWHLMTAVEYEYLLNQSREKGTMPHGNTDWGKDYYHNDEQGKVSNLGRTYTGTGPVTWNHDHTPYGVSDLKRRYSIMAAITLEVAKKHLEMWLEAESEVAINQSYTIGGKSFTRANLAEIRKQIEYWSNKVAELENLAKKKGRNRVYRIVPRDL